MSSETSSHPAAETGRRSTRRRRRPDILRLDESTLYRHLRNGTFPGLKIGGRYVVPGAVIERLVDDVLATGRCVDLGDWTPAVAPRPGRRSRPDRRRDRRDPGRCGMSVGALIFLAIVGSFICAKVRVAVARSASPLIALVLFVTTPLGAGLPHAIGSFFSTVSNATDPLFPRGAG